jgi:hypothetical protein
MTGTSWAKVTDLPKGFRAESNRGTEEYDFVICGTGYDPDPRLSPLLRGFSHHIALWQDRFSPQPGDESAVLSRSPYLGLGFEFTERVPGMAPYLRNIHNLNGSATTSMGNSAGAPGLRYSVPRIVKALVRDLFVDDADAYLADFLAYRSPEPEKISFREA